nr:ADP-glucose pyrophosphorylase small subunit [Ipomoea batatas]
MLLKSTTTLPDEIEDKVENLDDDDNEAKKRREVSGFDDEEEHDEENDEINVVAKALHKCGKISFDLKRNLYGLAGVACDRFSEVEKVSPLRMVTQDDVSEACATGDSDFKPVLKPYQLVGINLLSLLYRNKIGGAILTVVALPMDEKRATAFGLMTIGVEGRIIEFVEKPKGELLIAMKIMSNFAAMELQSSKSGQYGLSSTLPPCIRSITVFVVVNLLRQKFPGANDFGSEVIPGATSIGLRVQAYLFDGYWEDIGTTEAFYNANLGITKELVPDFNFYY